MLIPLGNFKTEQARYASPTTTENCYHFNNKTKKENGRKIAFALHDFLPFVSEG